MVQSRSTPAKSADQSAVLGGEPRRLADEASGKALERTRLRQTPGFYRRSWQRFRRNRIAVGALAVLFLIALFVLSAGLISRFVTGFTPSANHLSDKLAPPFTGDYILGTDGNGRDVLTRLAYGGRISLMIAILATVATLFIGTTVALVSGYFGGWVDAVLMRLVDIILCVPGLPLLILISILFRPGPTGLALILAAVSWPGIARIVRTEVLSLRKRDYIDAARVVGVPAPLLLVRHILPNVAPLIVVFASLAIPALILDEAVLSFLGLGVQVPTPSWGNMVQEGQRYFRGYPAITLIPGSLIYITSLCLYLFGSGVRDAFDPRMNT